MPPKLPDIHFQHIVPLVFLVASFVLASLCLSAGNKPGFMEEYALVRIDMSDLGKNILTSSNDTSSDDDDDNKDKDENEDDKKDKDDDDDDGGFLGIGGRGVTDDIGDAFDDAKDKAKEKVGEISGDIIEGLTEDLNIKPWYSLHVLTFCQGEFKNDTKNGTELDKSKFDVTECSTPNAKGKFNLTEILGGDHLSAGPIDIPIPSGIERQLQKFYGVLLGVVTFYAITIGLAVFAAVFNVIALVFPKFYPYRITMWAALLSSSAAMSAILGSAITTIGVSAASGALGDLGEFVGVRVVKGTPFVAITWATFGVVFVAAAYWGWMFWAARRRRLGLTREELKEAREMIKRLRGDFRSEHDRKEHETMGARFLEKAHPARRQR